ncbi:MAG: hypothetical protein JW932_16390 [Deltaproteobacteria bacterium]|nr:hypothetical protein [Deltaproteobacteria bacterium]
MRGVSEFIKEHNAFLKTKDLDRGSLTYHLTQIQFLQHERLIHLMVMLFVILCTLLFLGLYLFIQLTAFLIVFGLLLILTVFYIFHYYKLENTVIEWYFIYDEKMKETGSG